MADSRLTDLGRRTLVMGVLNVTPDSFSGDGIYERPDEAAARAQMMVASGADIIDIGGESTRPGYRPVPLEEELSRVLPALRQVVRAISIPISIDTSKAEVARQALAEGATMINDVSGLSDPDMVNQVAAAGAALVLVHNGPGRSSGRAIARQLSGDHLDVGTYRRRSSVDNSRTLSARAPGEDLLEEVVAELRRQIALAEGAGVAAERILVDPGFGFGKTWRENFEIMRRLAELQVLDKPVLVGPSRKGMIARVLGAEAGNRLEGSAALVAVCIAQGADVVRVHDIQEMAGVARVMDALVRPRSAAPLPTSRPAGAQRQVPAQGTDEPHP